MSRHSKPLVLLLLIACMAAPVAAYNIYLKDGSRIVAREKYAVEGDKAIITLENGTRTFLPLAEIDVARTDQANQSSIGNALIFDDGKFVERSEADTPEVEERETLGDLIARGEATMRGTTREDAAGEPSAFPVRAPAGEEFRRRPIRDLELAATLKSAFGQRGLEGAAIYEGTDPSMPLVELVAESEASVFRGLEVAADVLLEVREVHPESCAGLELRMLTANHQRAGEFALTGEMAESISSKAVELPTFFVRNVRF